MARHDHQRSDMSDIHGQVLIGVSAEVILDKGTSLLRHRDEEGRVLVTRQIQGVQYGDAIQIPFYGDVEVVVTEECRKCEEGIDA